MAINIDYGAGRGMAGMYQNLLNIQQEGQRQLAEKERRQQDIINQAFRAGGGFLAQRREEGEQRDIAGLEAQQAQALENLNANYTAGLDKYTRAIEQAAEGSDAQNAAIADLEKYKQSYQKQRNALSQQVEERKKQYYDSGFAGFMRDETALGGEFTTPKLYGVDQDLAEQQRAAVGKAQAGVGEAEAGVTAAQQRDKASLFADRQQEMYRRPEMVSVDPRLDVASQEVQGAGRAEAAARQDLAGAMNKAGEQRREGYLKTIGAAQAAAAARERGSAAKNKAFEDLSRVKSEYKRSTDSLREVLDAAPSRQAAMRFEGAKNRSGIMAGSEDLMERDAVFAQRDRRNAAVKEMRSLRQQALDEALTPQEEERVMVGMASPELKARAERVASLHKRANELESEIENYDPLSGERNKSFLNMGDSEAAVSTGRIEAKRVGEILGDINSAQSQANLDKTRLFQASRYAAAAMEGDLPEQQKAREMADEASMIGRRTDQVQSPYGSFPAPSKESQAAELDIAQKKNAVNLAQQDVAAAEQGYKQVVAQVQKDVKAGKPQNPGFVTQAQERLAQAQQGLEQAQSALTAKEAEIKEGFVTLPSGRMIPKEETAASVAEKERLKLRDEARADRFEQAGLDLVRNSDDPVAAEKFIADNELPEGFGDIIRSTVDSNAYKSLKTEGDRQRLIHRENYNNLIALGLNEQAFNYGQDNGLISKKAKFSDIEQTKQTLSLVRTLTDPLKAKAVLENMPNVSEAQREMHMAIVNQNKDNTDRQKAIALLSSPALSDKQKFDVLQSANIIGQNVKYQQFKNVNDELTFAAQNGIPVSENTLKNMGITEQEDQDRFNYQNTMAYKNKTYAPMRERFLAEIEGAFETATTRKGVFSPSIARQRVIDLASDPKYAEMAKFYGYDSENIINKMVSTKGENIAAERAAAKKAGLQYAKLAAEVAKGEREAKGILSPTDMAKEEFNVYRTVLGDMTTAGVGFGEATQAALSAVQFSRSFSGGKAMTFEEMMAATRKRLKEQGYNVDEKKGPAPAESTPEREDSSRGAAASLTDAERATNDVYAGVPENLVEATIPPYNEAKSGFITSDRGAPRLPMQIADGEGVSYEEFLLSIDREIEKGGNLSDILFSRAKAAGLYPTKAAASTAASKIQDDLRRLRSFRNRSEEAAK